MHDLSLEPLYLLVSDETPSHSGMAAAAALSAAERFSGGKPVVLINLEPTDSHHLADAVGQKDEEGLADALEFGLNLEATGFLLENGVRIVPIGTVRGDRASLFNHPAWARIIETARRRGTRLLAFVAADADLPRLAERAGAALLLASPEEESRLRARLPASLPIVGSMAPPNSSPPGMARRSGRKSAAPLSSVADGMASGPIRSGGPTPSPDIHPSAGEIPLSAAEGMAPAGPASPTGLPSDLGNELEAEAPQRPYEPSAASDVTLPALGDDAAENDPPGLLSSSQPEPPPRYTVPHVSRTRDRLIRIAAILILAYWTYYIVWRWTSTLNPEGLWFSVPLALAESWAWVMAFFLVFTTWRLNHREVRPAPAGLSVDVFITTCGEPLEILRRTAVNARDIRYPHRTFVLDDGRCEEVRAMAVEIGVDYITRDDNEYAKAGNLNNALRSTSGDFILLLDADDAPLPTTLHRLLGFFDDPRVAFVQTPQDFYNTDAFTTDVNERTKRIWEDQKLFFSVIQPGKDASNSAFFCGSCAVVRRQALAEIGGFSTVSVTEDIETSLLLHARGWKSVFHGESLVVGLAANSATAFHIQHQRWAEGAMQVLRNFNPLTHPGLSPAQRIGYFYSLSSYFSGVQKLIFYAAPPVFFFTGILPIRALDHQFLLRFVPYLILSLLLVELMGRGLAFTWIVERYQMAKFWTYTKAIATFLTNRRIPFRVTPKGPVGISFAAYAPQFLLLVATVLSVYWATFAYSRGWVEYTVPGWRSLAFQVGFLWAMINFTLAANVVLHSVSIRQRRRDHRFFAPLAIQVEAEGGDGERGEARPGILENLNTNGISFRGSSPVPVGATLWITLPLSAGEFTLEGTVIHARPDDGPNQGDYLHGVRFSGIPPRAREAIDLHCIQHGVPHQQAQYRPTAALRAKRGKTSVSGIDDRVGSATGALVPAGNDGG